MNVTSLRKWFTLTWDFRAEMQDRFPTPPRDHSLDFAYTEVAEALDATLRLNPTYKRNNEKIHSVERELTQCAMMLLTAIPSTYRDWASLDDYPFVSVWTVRSIAVRVGHCLEVPGDYAYILGTVAAISTAVNLDESLPAELDRMRAKHTTPQPHERIIEPETGDIVNWHWLNMERIRYAQPSEGLTLADHTDGVIHNG